jgi:hypothetical protein
MWGEQGSNSRPHSHRDSNTILNNRLSQKFKRLGYSHVNSFISDNFLRNWDSNEAKGGMGESALKDLIFRWLLVGRG